MYLILIMAWPSHVWQQHLVARWCQQKLRHVPSAICLMMAKKKKLKYQLNSQRYAVASNTVTGLNETFYLKNNCDSTTLEQGMINYITLLFIMMGAVFLNIYLERIKVTFDKDKQTAQDYSITITNPPSGVFTERMSRHTWSLSIMIYSWSH